MTQISLNGNAVEMDNFNTKDNTGLNIVVMNDNGEVIAAQAFDTQNESFKTT